MLVIALRALHLHHIVTHTALPIQLPLPTPIHVPAIPLYPPRPPCSWRSSSSSSSSGIILILYALPALYTIFLGLPLSV